MHKNEDLWKSVEWKKQYNQTLQYGRQYITPVVTGGSLKNS